MKQTITGPFRFVAVGIPFLAAIKLTLGADRTNATGRGFLIGPFLIGFVTVKNK